MVSVIRRMAKLRALLSIRLGPGAAILPPEITRIQMDFAKKLNDGHFGPRKFWQNCLPRLKYHNPAVPMSVNRTTDQEGPALMTIYFASPTATSQDAPPTSSSTNVQSPTGAVASSTSVASMERVETINMKHRTDSEILTQLMALTRAKPVYATPEEVEQLRELEEARKQSLRDQTRSIKENEKRKKRDAMLAQARGEIAATQTA